MSEISYQDNVRRGLTGPRTATCLLASYDRISERTGIRPQTYEQYEQARLAYAAACEGTNYIPPEIAELSREVRAASCKDLGVYSLRKVVETRVDTQDALQEKLGQLTLGGFRIAVYLDVGGLHAVGVKAIDAKYFDVKSTWSPFPAGEPVHVRRLFDWLDRAPRTRVREGSARKTNKASNIVALPAEPR